MLDVLELSYSIVIGVVCWKINKVSGVAGNKSFELQNVLSKKNKLGRVDDTRQNKENKINKK